MNEAHISPLQIGNAAAVDVELAEAKKALASGAKYFIGGHGGLAEKAQVEFKIAYLEKMHWLRHSIRSKDNGQAGESEEHHHVSDG